MGDRRHERAAAAQVIEGAKLAELASGKAACQGGNGASCEDRGRSRVLLRLVACKASRERRRRSRWRQ